MATFDRLLLSPVLLSRVAQWLDHPAALLALLQTHATVWRRVRLRPSSASQSTTEANVHVLIGESGVAARDAAGIGTTSGVSDGSDDDGGNSDIRDGVIGGGGGGEVIQSEADALYAHCVWIALHQRLWTSLRFDIVIHDANSLRLWSRFPVARLCVVYEGYVDVGSEEEAEAGAHVPHPLAQWWYDMYLPSLVRLRLVERRRWSRLVRVMSVFPARSTETSIDPDRLILRNTARVRRAGGGGGGGGSEFVAYLPNVVDLELDGPIVDRDLFAHKLPAMFPSLRQIALLGAPFYDVTDADVEALARMVPTLEAVRRSGKYSVTMGNALRAHEDRPYEYAVGHALAPRLTLLVDYLYNTVGSTDDPLSLSEPWPRMTKLRTLKLLGDCTINDANLRMCESLTALYLPRRCSAFTGECLASLHHLRTLQLPSNKISGIHEPRHNSMDEHMAHFALACGASTLRDLYLCDDTVNVKASVRAFTNLETLRCAKNTSDNEVAALSRLRTLICCVTWSGGQVGNTALKKLTALTALDMAEQRGFSDKGLRYCTALRVLRCGVNTKVSDASLAGMAHLHTLVCNSNARITDAGLRAVAPSLTHLNVGINAKITLDGVHALTSLRVLHMAGYTGVNRALLPHLHECDRGLKAARMELGDPLVDDKQY